MVIVPPSLSLPLPLLLRLALLLPPSRVRRHLFLPLNRLRVNSGAVLFLFLSKIRSMSRRSLNGSHLFRGRCRGVLAAYEHAHHAG